MPLREFPDSLGRIWEAWDTYPKRADDAAQAESAFSKYVANLVNQGRSAPTSVRSQYQAGWLTFKLDNARRRLAPIPSGWESADDTTWWLTLEAAAAPGRREICRPPAARSL